MFEFPDPVNISERSYERNNPRDMSTDNEPSFSIVENISQRGKPKLFEKQGYSYTDYRKTRKSRSWRCAVRRKGRKPCPAKVKQCLSSGTFERNGSDHNHDKQVHGKTKALMMKECYTAAVENVFTPAGQIIDNIKRKYLHPTPLPNCIKVSNAKRNSNRKREKNRPKCPSTIEEELLNQHIPPDFLISDELSPDGCARNLIFATDEQLRILGERVIWYIDATFKVVKDPYQQLFSIHAYIKSNDATKQVPLAFVLMSRRQKDDYTRVFRIIIDEIRKRTGTDPKVEKVVLDYERAMWSSLKSFMPDAVLQGCAFHFTKALVKHINEIGLGPQFNADGATRDLLKEMLALCYISPRWIRPLFKKLKDRCTTPKLLEFAQYMQDTWIENSFITPAMWSVYLCRRRTNNTVEGWHQRLNARGKSDVPFYLLVSLLHSEAIVAVIDANLVCDGGEAERNHIVYKKANEKLFNLWHLFSEAELAPTTLLKKCAKLYSPDVV